MEQRVWNECKEKLEISLTGDSFPSLQTLSSVRSLVINPSTYSFTISSILQTLTTHSLSPQYTHHIFYLLCDLTVHHPDLSLSVSTSLHSFSSTLLSDSASSPRLAAAALSTLLSVSPANDLGLEDGLLLSLPFRPCISVRVWFLNNVLRFQIRPNLLLTLLLGFTKDPYPCVRQAALAGLVRVCESGVEVDDCAIIEGCYFRSVELLNDQEEYVRVAAVRSVSKWGRMLIATKEGGDKKDWSSVIFLQICAMVRDMNVGVRVEAFESLGKVAFVSEDILLQSVSKKLLATTKMKQVLAPSKSRLYEIQVSTAAGVFIHGLEDEYSEVQRSACISLRMLSILSRRFASEAVNLLTYVLNDDSAIIRIEALDALHHMATSGFLKMQEEHIDMLLGTLVDNNPDVRLRALSILGLVQLPDLHVSKLTVQGLLGSLDVYPQSEAEIFRTLFRIGQNHSNYAVRVFEDYHNEIETSASWKLDGTNSRVAGLLVLVISASLKHEDYSHPVPPRILPYAAVFFGRISSAFSDVLDKQSLLAYLSHCGWASEVESESRAATLPATEGQLEASACFVSSVKFILATVNSLWKLMKSGCTSEVLKTLRFCKESLLIMRTDSPEQTSAVSFVLQYVRVIKLFTKVWDHWAIATRKWHISRIGGMELLLQKLNRELLALRFQFLGLTEEDEVFVHELLLLYYILALLCFHTNCNTTHNLSSIVTRVNYLRNEKSIATSEFVNQLVKLSHYEVTGNSHQWIGLADAFTPRVFSLGPRMKHISAEFVVQGFSSISPLRFIPGLPVGIPLEITLSNVTIEHRLWVKMSSDENQTEFRFVDVEFEGSEDCRHFVFTSTFYGTPKAVGFSLKVCIGMECDSEDFQLVQHGYGGGPRHSLVYLCPEKEVHFVRTS